MAKAEQIFTGDWYPWYAEKALTAESIDHLTLAEEGAYRRALDKAWLKGSLPADPKELARVIGRQCTAKIAQRVLEIPLFKPMKGDRKRVVHVVLERVREEQSQKHSKNVERAANAAKKRWDREANKDGGADACSIPQANLKHAIKNKKENKKEEEETHNTHARESASVIDAVDAKKLGYPVENLFAAFPDLTIHPGQLGMIQVEVHDTPVDRKAWDETIRHYAGNHDPTRGRYLPEKVGNLLSVFKDKRAKLEQKNGTVRRNDGNGNGRASSLERIAEHREILEQYPTEAELGRQS